MIKQTLTAALVATLLGCNSGSSVALNGGTADDSPAEDTVAENTPPSTESDAADSAQQPQACSAPASLGQAFSDATGDQSDPLFTPLAAIDGCSDTPSSWSGDQGESITLDVGSVENVQGIYLWMSYDRSEWLSIEQSVDGESWTPSWRRIQNLENTASTYFSLNAEAPSRFIRITGFGSDLNAWTNIAEARWSLSGEVINTDRVWRHNDNLVALHSGDERAASPHYQGPLSTMFISCPYLGNPVYVDATGTRDDFWQVQTIGDTLVYSFDWDHYPRSAEPDFYGAPLITYEPMRHAQALLEPLSAADPLTLFPSDCATTNVSDALHIIDEMLAQADAGLLSTATWR